MTHSDKNRTVISEGQLVALLHAGDENAMHSLFRKYYRGLVYYSYQITRHQSESEDIVSESFMKYFSAKELYSSLLEIKNFLYIAVKNASLNYVKIQTNRSRLIAENISPFLAEIDVDSSTEMVKAELITIFSQALEQLNATQRQVIENLIYGNSSVKDIAKELNTSEVNVWQIKSRAVKVLKAYVTANVSKEYLLVILLKIFDLYE